MATSIIESFMSSFSSLFGSATPSKLFTLSNLEPLLNVLKRDLQNNDYKYYGIHLQGVVKEAGKDMLNTTIPNIKHQYQGEVLVDVIDPNTNLIKLLSKSIPGKKIIVFGTDKAPRPIKKGWENFQYKLMKDPTVIGIYSMSSETKSESLKKLFEGFQCENFQHSTQSCKIKEVCNWKGFPSVSTNDINKKECIDYK